MVDRVLENVRPLGPGDNWIVVTQEMVGPTRGAVETILRASEIKYDGDVLVNPTECLTVANCDQLIKIPEDLAIQDEWDGVVFTFHSSNPAHSYVQCLGDQIWHIREKEVISNRAVSGVYWFRTAGPFLEACKTVLNSVQGELYLSSAIEELITMGACLVAVDAPTAILGTPEDFQRMEVAISVFQSTLGCKLER